MRTEQTIRISASVDAVWSVIHDVSSWPDWTASIRRVEVLDGQPLQVGSRVRIQQPRLPTAVWQVTELVPGRSFTWVNRSPGMTSVGTHSVAPGEDGVAVAALSLDQSGPLSFLARPFLGLTRRYVQLEAEGLKARSEQTTA
jgi:uncharacterized membrane protein